MRGDRPNGFDARTEAIRATQIGKGSMTSLRALIAASPDTSVTIGALLIGFLFGALLLKTNFCTMGAISDWLIAGSRGRLGASALAAATAIVGTQALSLTGIVDLGQSLYLMPRINWAGAIGGGLLFGAGMVFAGGCPSRALARAGTGDVRALLAILIVGIAAYATISGVLGHLRVGLDVTTAFDLRVRGYSSQSLPHVIDGLGLHRWFGWAFALMVTAGLFYVAFGYAAVAATPLNLAGGLGVGILAVAGWALTGLAADDFAAMPVQPASLSFVKPAGDAVDWIERATALGLPGFGAASVFGALVGALSVAVISGRFRLAGFIDRADAVRHVGGAVAMGIGGVVALGCTIGQGVTGISTLAVQSFIASAAIFSGAAVALKYLERSI